MTYTIKGKHLAGDIIVNFAGALGFDFHRNAEPVGEARVIHAAGPDGLGDFVDAYVQPLTGGLPLHVEVNPEQDYALLG